MSNVTFTTQRGRGEPNLHTNNTKHLGTYLLANKICNCFEQQKVILLHFGVFLRNNLCLENWFSDLNSV